MNIPKTLKIGGKTYDVTVTENITLGSGCNGEILYNDLKINIRPMARANMEACLIHEIMHGIHANLGYIEHDEKQIEELAEALYAVFVDNPELLEEDTIINEVTP